MKIIITQDKQERFEINGKMYEFTTDLLLKKVTVIPDMNYKFDVYRDKYCNYVLRKCESYPCFDSSDRMYENRFYGSYMICTSMDEAIEKYNYIMEHDPVCRADEDTPSFLAPLIYADDGKATISIMTDSNKNKVPDTMEKVHFWNKISLLLLKMKIKLSR
jgi:hypothetical protein